MGILSPMNNQKCPLTYTEMLENLYHVRNHIRSAKDKEAQQMKQHIDDLIKLLVEGK